MRHGILSIDDEVHDDLFDLAGVGKDGPCAVLQLHEQLNIVAYEAAQHAVEAPNQIIEGNVLRLAHLLAAVSQPTAWLVPAMGGGRSTRPPSSGHTGYHREQVVEIVGDGAGKPSDALKLLGLPKLLFKPLALRHFKRHANKWNNSPSWLAGRKVAKNNVSAFLYANSLHR